jgi:hypothetical protein
VPLPEGLAVDPQRVASPAPQFLRLMRQVLRPRHCRKAVGFTTENVADDTIADDTIAAVNDAFRSQ